MDFTSFLTSLGTSFVIFLVLMIVFAFLSSRPGNNVVYYPNRILKGLDPLEGGYKSRNPFSWIKEALTSFFFGLGCFFGLRQHIFVERLSL